MPKEQVRCPGCDRTQPKTDAGLYYCVFCRCQFDDDPDEGGTHSTDPTRRIQHEEDRRENRRWRRSR